MKFNVKKSDRVALILYFLGFKYGCSSFEDMITYGYGELDDYGFWEYELIPN